MKSYLPWMKLSSLGILGINKRNTEYIAKYNPRKNYPLVDDKRITKTKAIQNGIAVPQLYGIIDMEHQIRDLPGMVRDKPSFVIKPARGCGGEGILIIEEHSANGYVCVNGNIITHSAISHHISNILSGMYSLSGKPDSALIEYKVNFDMKFSQVSYRGVPDIRTLVFMGIPVMSMLRLPTRTSNGKANLHQGAVGVGIKMDNGVTRGGIWHDGAVNIHPDTGNPLSGLVIENWDEILLLNSRCHDLSCMGFIGVDIVLDRDYGPLMLEINARPGLSIQMANQAGLLPRLKHIESLMTLPNQPEERIQITRMLENSFQCYA